MTKKWEERSTITANLLNPAFCGEVLRRTVLSYNDNEKGLKFPFILSFLVLPILLHKNTRENMPVRSSTYFHAWVDENEHLFLGFADRSKQMMPYTKEALLFLMVHKSLTVDEIGFIEVGFYRKSNPRGENTTEVNQIYKKADLLGKWMRLTGNVQTIFMFLKISP